MTARSNAKAPPICGLTGVAEGVSRFNSGLTPPPPGKAAPDPDARVAGRVEREAWFYVRRAGPSAWIRVVVHYKEDRGTIVTAFPRRSFP